MPVIRSIHDKGLFPPGTLLAGDEVVAINGHPLRDVIDARFYAAEEDLQLTVRRPDGSLASLAVSKDIDADLGVEWEPDRIRICKANCDFCFVHQQPKKILRRTLYIKDDDYRLSFLHGNFVTLTNMTEEDYERIFEQRLSPLYVSVHCTNDDVRRALLRKPDADPIVPLLQRLHRHGIQTHAQIVVTPGMNDGEMLYRSLDDLMALYPHVPSVGVVPLGLTRYRANLPDLDPVSRESASRILREIDKRRQTMQRRFEFGFIYAADDMFLIAGQDIPGDGYYDDYCQLENGIGMLRQLLETYEARRDELPSALNPARRFCVITGRAAGPFIAELCRETETRVQGLRLVPLVVDNDFWGHTVTTANLLTGSDIASQVKRATPPVDAVILPPECLNTDGLFLDDETPGSVALSIGLPVLRSEYDFIETIFSCALSPGNPM